MSLTSSSEATIVASARKTCAGKESNAALRRNEQLRFIDLFSGLGGFHLALEKLGHRCVFASELDPKLRELYAENFGIEAAGDIRRIEAEDIPVHEVLCAGFPCQPFSKAGGQTGLEDPRWGDLFTHIMRIVEHHKPRYLILENVANLERHDQGRTWRKVQALLKAQRYDIRAERLSPHHFGIPQIRDRFFIVGSLEGLSGFQWPTKSTGGTSIRDILDEQPEDARPLSQQALECIEVWQEFLDLFPAGEEPPSFPMWTAEFGADYPFEGTTPHAIGAQGLKGYRGAHGAILEGRDQESTFAALPSYARTAQDRFPEWKKRFIRQNRDFYKRHKAWIDQWLPKLLTFPASLQKFEWNAKGERKLLSELVLQFRASGLRAKRPTTAPSLIAMTTTQVPVITWEQRYMTPRECAKLQSMQGLRLPETATRAYAALGNAVNASLARSIAGALLAHDTSLQAPPYADVALPYAESQLSLMPGEVGWGRELNGWEHSSTNNSQTDVTVAQENLS